MNPIPDAIHTNPMEGGASPGAISCMHSQKCLIALAIIIFIGSFVASGLSFAHIGYPSFAIGGAGLLISTGLIIKVLLSQNTPTVDLGTPATRELNTPNTQGLPTPQLPLKEQAQLPLFRGGAPGTQAFLPDQLHGYCLFLATIHPEIAVFESTCTTGFSKSVLARQLTYYSERNNGLLTKNIPLIFNVGYHFVLLYINRKERTVEYYDSLANNGRFKSKLEEITQWLTEKEPGEPYELVFKISQSIQPDGYQCGAWVLFFLQMILENP